MKLLLSFIICMNAKWFLSSRSAWPSMYVCIHVVYSVCACLEMCLALILVGPKRRELLAFFRPTGFISPCQGLKQNVLKYRTEMSPQRFNFQSIN